MGGLKQASRVVVWIVFLYVILECGYRLYKFGQLKSELARNTRYSFSTFKSPIYTLDPQAGYAYAPNAQNRQWLYDHDNNLLPHSSSVVTNNFGLMSPS